MKRYKYDGITFDSKSEAKWYDLLAIRLGMNIETHKRFDLSNGEYTCDFYLPEDETAIEVKGGVYTGVAHDIGRAIKAIEEQKIKRLIMVRSIPYFEEECNYVVQYTMYYYDNSTGSLRAKFVPLRYRNNGRGYFEYDYHCHSFEVDPWDDDETLEDYYFRMTERIGLAKPIQEYESRNLKCAYYTANQLRMDDYLISL